MREIKFRAWDEEQKHLTEVMTLSYRDGQLDCVHYSRKGGCYMHDPESYVLMQYTGLHDKKGKEIYEGDIIKLRGAPPFVVEWDKRGAWFLKQEAGSLPFIGTLIRGNVCEVIGNIYESPELLSQPAV